MKSIKNEIFLFFTYYLKIIVIFVWGVAQPSGVLMYKVVCLLCLMIALVNTVKAAISVKSTFLSGVMLN